MKICKKCGLEKDFILFPKCKLCRNKVTSICKKCTYERVKRDYYHRGSKIMYNFYQNLKLDEERHNKYLITRKKYAIENKDKSLYYSCKRRAEKYKLPFNIEISDIIIPEYCPLLETKIILNGGTGHFASPTLDKIIPELGYIKGNIRVISRKANVIKSNANKEELIKFSKNILKYIK